MNRAGSWLIAVFILLSLAVGGLFSTGAWLYQAGSNQPAPTLAPVLTPVPPVAQTSTDAATATSVPASFVPNTDNGQQIYAQLCDSCHPDGGEGVGPSLRSAEFKSQFADDALLRTVISDGQGTMPAFPQLTDRELADLVAFIRTLE